jgi:hypothetical protein
MHKDTGNSQIDHLNQIAVHVAKKRDSAFGALSTGEQCYVALASNRIDLLFEMGYTIPEAIARLGESWLAELLYCWQHAGNPAKWTTD